MKKENRLWKSGVRALASTVAALSILTLLPQTAGAAPPVPGAIFTTNSGCTNVNQNIFEAKADVYLDGGPTHPGAAGLPDGSYYVQVTEPDGTLLGSSVGEANERPFVVTNGEGSCLALSDMVGGFDDTSNPGGEYKVWVSTDRTFPESSSKTDNFKVRSDEVIVPESPHLQVQKFYDANANGVNDDNQPITGWKVRIRDGMDLIRYTPVDLVVAPDDYVVTEFTPVEQNWMLTTTNPVNVTIADTTKVVEFGNLCLGAGGGLTLGFWSNKNGQALFGADDLALMVSLNLRNATGSAFDPASYAAFRTWLLNATATNMAYMLSAQLATMELNVLNGKVSGSSLIYAPGTASANSLGFATVNAVMGEANAALGVNGNTTQLGPDRTLQEALKNALDRANNNLNFVQPTPCAFSFPV
jgi:hypothetical protein